MIYTNRFSLGRTEGEWRDECRAMNERSAEKTDQPRYRKKGEAFFSIRQLSDITATAVTPIKQVTENASTHLNFELKTHTDGNLILKMFKISGGNHSHGIHKRIQTRTLRTNQSFQQVC